MSSLSMRWLLPAAVALLSGCGQDLLFAEIEFPQVCETLVDEEIIAAPVALDAEIPHKFEYDFQERIPNLDRIDDGSDIRLLGVKLTAKDVPNFDFVEKVVVDLQGAADGSLGTLHLEYLRDPANPVGSTIDLNSDADIISYIKLGLLRLDTVIRGTLPTHPWHMDIRMCLYVKTRVKYLEAAQSASQ